MVKCRLFHKWVKWVTLPYVVIPQRHEEEVEVWQCARCDEIKVRRA